MPSKLVRIVLDMTSNHFSVEYGEKKLPGLTQAQKEEKDSLNEDLIEFSDFTLAEQLDDEERQGMMTKKKRLVELTEMEKMEHVEWFPLEEHLIESLLVVVSPRDRHTYVENLPVYLLDRILDPKGNVTINVGSLEKGVLGAPSFPIPLKEEKEEEAPIDDPGGLQTHTENEATVIRVIAPDTPGWADMITVKEDVEGRVFVRPNKFLGDDWKPINRSLREVFGECWKSEGRGDAGAHWLVNVK